MKGYCLQRQLKTPCGSQFTLSTQLVILNYPVILSHQHSSTVLLETYLLYSYVPGTGCGLGLAYQHLPWTHFDHLSDMSHADKQTCLQISYIYLF